MPIYMKPGQISVTGLGTFTYIVQSTQMHFLSAVSQEQPPSSLSIVINQNGSPVASSSTPSAAQMVVGAQTHILCTAGDVITFVLSSSAPIDEQIGAISTTLITREGY